MCGQWPCIFFFFFFLLMQMPGSLKKTTRHRLLETYFSNNFPSVPPPDLLRRPSKVWLVEAHEIIWQTLVWFFFLFILCVISSRWHWLFFLLSIVILKNLDWNWGSAICYCLGINNFLVIFKLHFGPSLVHFILPRLEITGACISHYQFTTDFHDK